MSSEGPPAKVRRLEPADFESTILGSEDEVLPDEQVPFVNRHSELFDLFLANARVILKLLRHRPEGRKQLRSWRSCKVAVAAQMFGSGKTTLGENFIGQLSNPDFQNFAKEKMMNYQNKMDFDREWESAKNGRRRCWDLRGCESLQDVAQEIGCEGQRIRDIAAHIWKRAVKKSTPFFVHFDEIGELGEKVIQLRDVVGLVWKMMLKSAEPMPRIYFYLSGKNVPLTSLGGPSSPFGTKWIILDLLEAKHVKTILQNAKGLSQSLRDFVGLARALTEWTGGSPRLLVYCIRALEYLAQSEDGLDADVEKNMDKVYGMLMQIGAVASEVFLKKADEETWREAWMHLVLLAQLQVPCTRDMELPVGSHKQTLEKLLGRLNVYISKPRAPAASMEDAFYVCHMKMIDKFVRQKYSSDCRVCLFLGDATPMDPAQLLERLVEQRIIVRACLGSGAENCTWKNLLKPMLKGTMADDKRVVLDTGSPIHTFPKVTESAGVLSEVKTPLPEQLNPENLDSALELVSSNKIYRPAPQSGSADTFIKQPTFTIELQDKSGVAEGVTFRNVCDEAAKCLKNGQVIWILIAMKLSKRLARFVGAKPLVLKVGCYQVEGGTSNGGLLYRRTSSEKWTHKIVDGKRLEAASTVKGKGKVLCVRAGLELVIVPTAAVKAFLGNEDFEIVKGLAQKSKDEKNGGSVDVPFLSRFYNFTGSSGPISKPAELDDDTVITVVFGELKKEVQFRRQSTAAAVKEAICVECCLPVGTVLRLENNHGRGVAIDGHLAPGTYTVVPQDA